MNERIKELAELSGFKVDWQHEDVQALKMARFEKFAELIVRECQFAIVSRTDLPKHERKLYNNVLKEHFGVEE